MATGLLGILHPQERCRIAHDWLISELSKPTRLAEIAAALDVLPGAVLSYCTSSAAVVVVYMAALEQAADNCDRRARQVLDALKVGKFTQDAVRCARDVSTSYRAQAEAARRFAESIARRLSAVEVDLKTQRKARAAKSAAISQQAHHDKAHAEHLTRVAKFGRPAPTANVIRTAGSAPSPEELQALLPGDVEHLRYLATASGDQAAQQYLDQVRADWISLLCKSK